VPFVIYRTGNTPDQVECYDEFTCQSGSFGLLKGNEFINEVFRNQPGSTD